MSSMFSSQDRDHLLNHRTVNINVACRFKRLLSDVRATGLPLLVWEVYRSDQHQQELYCQGRCNPYLHKMGVRPELICRARLMGYSARKPRITRNRVGSFHTRGCAMDCCWLVKSRPCWDVPIEWWQCYGQVARRWGLCWGGDRKIPNMAHVQWVKSFRSHR